MIARAFVAALAAVALAQPLAARSAPQYTDVLAHYLDALRAGRYATAYALLSADERRYFRTPANYASGFAADGYALLAYRVGARSGPVVVVDERIAFDDPAHDVRVTTNVRVPYVVRGAGGDARVVDAGRPWRAYASAAQASADGVRVTVEKLAYYARAISVVVRMENTGSGFVTILPYGRSVLRDGATIYRPLIARDGDLTDRQFVLGVRLAPRTRYTGAIAFVTPPLADRIRPLTLTLGPVMRDGAAAPASIDVAAIVPRS